MAEHEFTVVSTLMTEKGEIIKDNIKTRSLYDLADIIGLDETFNDKGNVRTKHCTITHRERGTILVYGSYDEIKEIVKPIVKPIGFIVNNSNSNGKVIQSSKQRTGSRTRTT